MNTITSKASQAAIDASEQRAKRAAYLARVATRKAAEARADRAVATRKAAA